MLRWLSKLRDRILGYPPVRDITDDYRQAVAKQITWEEFGKRIIEYNQQMRQWNKIARPS